MGSPSRGTTEAREAGSGAARAEPHFLPSGEAHPQERSGQRDVRESERGQPRTDDQRPRQDRDQQQPSRPQTPQHQPTRPTRTVVFEDGDDLDVPDFLK